MDEDETTEYGEFVCSFDKWLPIEEQKRKAKKLANLTKNENNNSKRKTT